MEGFFERLARYATAWTGSTTATLIAFGGVLAWTIGGFFVGFSDTYQLWINTLTTIVTFLMVFLIQRSQNKDSHAIQLKLNEVVAALKGASNRLINVEDLSEEEVRALHQHYNKLAQLTEHDSKITRSHSVEEALTRHEKKKHAGGE